GLSSAGRNGEGVAAGGGIGGPGGCGAAQAEAPPGAAVRGGGPRGRGGAGRGRVGAPIAAGRAGSGRVHPRRGPGGVGTGGLVRLEERPDGRDLPLERFARAGRAPDELVGLVPLGYGRLDLRDRALLDLLEGRAGPPQLGLALVDQGRAVVEDRQRGDEDEAE